MSSITKLSEQAKQYCKACLLTLPREELVEKLEAISIACYDDEDNEILADAAVDSVEAGDIHFDWSFAFSKSMPHSVKMMWLDIDEIWE